MITVRDLARKLTKYAEIPGNADVEVMLCYDGDVAFPFKRGDDNSAFGDNRIERFLVLMPDLRGKRLVLERKE